MKITAAVLSNEIMCDQISKKKDGTFIFREGYFYSHGGSSQKFADNIENQLKAHFPTETFEKVDNGNHWAAFRGSAKLANQTHWYVIFRHVNNSKEVLNGTTN